jgi:hypothetical protein
MAFVMDSDEGTWAYAHSIAQVTAALVILWFDVSCFLCDDIIFGAYQQIQLICSCIARPVLGMHLRAVDLLDLSLREQLSICHDINKGFIVDQVWLHLGYNMVSNFYWYTKVLQRFFCYWRWTLLLSVILTFCFLQVIIDSAAERLGIRQGNVIVFREMCGSTLPEVHISKVFVN